MDEDISRDVMMLRPAKKIWQTLQSTYGHEKNIARICEIYEHLFTHRQGERSVQEFYNSLRALLDELEIYQSFVVDISKMHQYIEELVVAIFLASCIGISDSWPDTWC